MRQLNDTDGQYGESTKINGTGLKLSPACFPEELARRITTAQGQARLTPELTLGLLHKLNNVMTSIYFTAEGCESDVESGHSVRETLGDLTRAVRDAQQLITQAAEVNLTLGRTEPEYHDLNLLVQQELFLMKMLLPKSAVVDVETLTDRAFVRVSLADFRHVLFSLAANASDAAGENPRVSLHTLASSAVNADEYLPALPTGYEEMVALVFRDNGHGMTQETMAGAFSPFFTTRADRVGLGLFHAQEIARRNGGQLAIRRSAQAGTEVVWAMPRIAE